MQKRKILITGGPVHAHIDDVKIVTNRFRGGLMASLASELADSLTQDYNCSVIYLTAPGAIVPDSSDNLEVRLHRGYYDYLEQVLALAPQCTDVILGAAVANLIPAHPIKGKFPSHNYNEGDIVSLDFLVTPRVITKVKAVAPRVNLIGFKLLSGAPHEELLAAAWHTLMSSRATAVVANDTTDLQMKYVRTKEGGVHAMPNHDLAAFLWEVMTEQHYRTEVESAALEAPPPSPTGVHRLKALIAHYRQAQPGLFVTTDDGLVFGTAAVRNSPRAEPGFWTTSRGKRELDDVAYVREVNHQQRVVTVAQGKASLNAPLLDTIFKAMPHVTAIVHGHIQDPALQTLPYAQPGTVRDSQREIKGSFNIEGHGCFYLLDESGTTLFWKD
jgi:hypothetical protein